MTDMDETAVEAVAWMWTHTSSGAYQQVNMHYEPDAYGPNWTCTPLYAANPATARVAKLEEALVQIELLSTNHGGWFEQDPFGEYVKLGQIATEARREVRARQALASGESA